MPQVISSIKALIEYQGKYLFLVDSFHKGNIWDLPGGKIEYGETPEQTLHREIKEETSLEVNIIQSIGVWFFFTQHHHHQVICHTYLCHPRTNPTIDITQNPADEPITDFQWLTLDEVLSHPSITLADSLKELLSNYRQSK